MDYTDKLNPEQKKAVTHEDGPLLIVAGAGTGKTTVITQRIAWLIMNKKATPEEILAVTFTDKAAGEMEERVDKILPYGYLDLWISTFHSFCERILKDHGLEIGIPNDFKLFNQTEQWLLVRRNMEKFELDYYQPLGNPTKFIHALVKHFSRAKDEAVSPEEYLEYAKSLELNKDSRGYGQWLPIDEEVKKKLSKKELKEIMDQEIKKVQEVADAYHVYQQLLLDNNALDFGDLINYTLKLFQKRPLVLEKFRKQFKYMLVDEFQDTNWAQYELLKLLAGPKNNITVVGDDDQSVYKFRGASISNILAFKKDYPKTKELVLTKNYRSCQNILDLSYKFIQQNNPNRLEAQLKGDKKISKRLQSKDKCKGVIEEMFLPEHVDEAQAVVKKIIELKDKDKNASWDDFAILVRANDTAEQFVNVLEDANVPYQFMASRGLYTKPIILDLIAYLKLLDNYHESSAVYRLLSLPYWSIPTADIIAISNHAKRKSMSLYEVLQHIQAVNVDEKTIVIVSKFLAHIEKHTSLAKDLSVSRIIFAFLDDFNYLQHLKKLPEQKSREAFSYLNQFYKEIREFEQESITKDVKSFLEQLNYVLESGEKGALTPDWEAGPESVKVMTIHGAKGLEFKTVFLVSLVDKRFPTIERKEQIELPDKLVKDIIPEGDIHLQEERRLFYVAMTRAKNNLYLTRAEDYGGVRKKKPSRFLIELGLVKDEPPKGKGSGKDIATKRKSLKTIKDEEIIYKDAIPTWFSFTQLKAFETCPYQYRFAHILKIPMRGKAVFSFGKAIHRTLEQFFSLVQERAKHEQKDLFSAKKVAGSRPQVKVKLEELMEIYEHAWIDDWFDSKNHEQMYKRNGRESLKRFYDLIKDDMPIPKYLEKKFRLKFGDYTVIGVIDRVDEVKKGEIEIVDYKTGKSKDAKKLYPEDKEQLLIYQMAVNQVFEEKPVLLSYYYLEGNKKVSFIGSQAELKKTEEKIIKTMEEIGKGKFPAKPSQNKCKFCDFSEICEYRIL